MASLVSSHACSQPATTVCHRFDSMLAYGEHNVVSMSLLTQTAQELTTMAWSKNGVYLAIGTAKGNLLLYNRYRAGRGQGRH